jgi:hypothetical protein
MDANGDLKAGHAAANIAGGMRVKSPNHVPLKNKEDENAPKETPDQNNENERQLEHNDTNRELEHLRNQEAAEKLARMQEATAPKHNYIYNSNAKYSTTNNVGVQQMRKHNHAQYNFKNVDRS